MPGEGFHTLTKGVLFSSCGTSHLPLKGRFSYPYKGSFVLFPNQWGTSQSTPLRGPASLLAHRLVPTPFGEQPPRWHIVRCLTLIPFVTAQIHLYQILSYLSFPSWVSPQGFKTRLLGEGFHTLIKGVLFSSPTNVGHHTFNRGSTPFH